MKLVIDAREHKLIEGLTELGCPFETANLDLGDIIFMQDNGETTLVVERKTVADLAASIKDGRYLNQKVRLKQLHDAKRCVMYLIEGDINRWSGIPNRAALQTATFNLQFRDGFRSTYPCTIKETCEWVKMTLERLGKTSSNQHQSQESQTIKSFLKRKRKDLVMRDNFMILALSQIPGVSLEIGRAAAKKYGNLNELICAYSAPTDDECRMMLSTLQLESGRQVGQAVSRAIFDYLTGLV